MRTQVVGMSSDLQAFQMAGHGYSEEIPFTQVSDGENASLVSVSIWACLQDWERGGAEERRQRRESGWAAKATLGKSCGRLLGFAKAFPPSETEHLMTSPTLPYGRPHPVGVDCGCGCSSRSSQRIDTARAIRSLLSDMALPHRRPRSPAYTESVIAPSGKTCAVGFVRCENML